MIVSQKQLGGYGFLLCSQRTFCYKPNGTRPKGSPPEKNTTSKEELLTLSLGKGVVAVGEDDDE
jgi:hypothetical protein